MKIKELLVNLDISYPFLDAEKWDNIGLLIGDENSDTNSIYVSLDVTSVIIDQIPENSTLITHHPLIFNPLKKIDFNSYHGKLIKKLIDKNISYIVLHTNYDKNFLNKYFIEKVLKRDFITGNEFLDFCYIPNQSLGEFRKFLSYSMSCLNRELKVIGSKEDIIRKVAVCTGSGSSYINEAKKWGVDVLITGDITYHIAMEAKEIGLNIIDITHYHSEKWFGDDLVDSLNAIKLDSGNPFEDI